MIKKIIFFFSLINAIFENKIYEYCEKKKKIELTNLIPYTVMFTIKNGN